MEWSKIGWTVLSCVVPKVLYDLIKPDNSVHTITLGKANETHVRNTRISNRIVVLDSTRLSPEKLTLLKAALSDQDSALPAPQVADTSGQTPDAASANPSQFEQPIMYAAIDPPVQDSFLPRLILTTVITLALGIVAGLAICQLGNFRFPPWL